MVFNGIFDSLTKKVNHVSPEDKGKIKKFIASNPNHDDDSFH